MNRLINEPLIHFVGIAALLFTVNLILSNREQVREDTIFVSSAEQERMVALFTSEAGRLPNPAEVRGMLADHVRNEALAREAKRLGLDDDDVIIERRLSQKMMFMLTDLKNDVTYSEADLEDWFNQNIERFERPEQVSFDHVFFREADHPEIANTLRRLNSEPEIDWRAEGEPFMLQRQYGALPRREVVRVFGRDFSDAVFSLTGNYDWQGPVSSALGAHLIRIRQFIPAKLPELSDIRDEVALAYEDELQRQANSEAIDELVSSYRVELEGITP